MRVKIFVMVVLTTVVFIIGIAVAGDNQGAENMDLDAGRKGTVDFSHFLHQTTIGDCNACHSSFPKTAGAIKDLIEQKKLKKKQIMNKTCLKCHKAKKKAGEKTGPTKCSVCHVK